MPNKVVPLVAAVAVGYLLLIAVLVMYVPAPWNWVGAGTMGLMGLRFIFTVRAAAKIGTRRTQSGQPK